MIGTCWSLVPAVVAIALALITKEVYSSLFVGILIGGAFYSGLSFPGFFNHVVKDGFVGVLSGRSQIAKVTLFRKRTDAETDVLCGQARNSAEFHCICGRFMVG